MGGDGGGWVLTRMASRVSVCVAAALLGLAPAAFGVEHRITNGTGDHYRAKWSPDGAKLICCTHSLSHYWLDRVDAATGTETCITPDMVSRYFPEWSSDGVTIAYTRKDSSNWYQVCTMPSSGAADTYCTTDPNHHYLPRWSDDGTTLSFFSTDSSGYFQVFIQVPSPIGGEVQVTSGSRNHAFQSWSPDKTHLAYEIQDANNDLQIAVLNLHTNIETMLTSDAFDHTYPEWSPDGSSIVYLKADATGTWQVYTVPSAGGAEKALTSDNYDHASATYSPAGDSIAYLRSDSTSSQQICKIPIGEGGTELALTSGDAQRAEPEWSPDGSWIAYRRLDPTGYWQIYRASNWNSVGWAAFSSTDKTAGLVLYGGRDGKGMSGLAATPIGTTGGINTHYTLCHFTCSSRWYTGVVVTNLESIPVTATLTAYDSAGTQLASKSETIPALGKISKLVSSYMGISNGSGWIDVVATGRVSVFDLYGDQIDGGQAAVPSAQRASTVILPSFTCSSAWWTGVAVANPNGYGVDATITAYDANGISLGSAVKTINANGKFSSMLDALLPVANKSGWVEITATEHGNPGALMDIAAIGMYGDKSAVPNEIAGVAGMKGSQSFTFSDFHMVPEGQTWKSWTSVAIVNPGPSAATLKILAFTRSGVSIGKKSVTLQPKRMTASMVSTLFTLGSNQEGWIMVQSTNPVVGMEFVKLDDPDTQTWGLAGIEAQEAALDLCMPHYDCGTTWWTRFALANTTTGTGLLTGNAYSNDGISGGETSMLLTYYAGAFDGVTQIFGVE